MEASRKGLEFMDATQKITGRQLGPQGPGHEQTIFVTTLVEQPGQALCVSVSLPFVPLMKECGGRFAFRVVSLGKNTELQRPCSASACTRHIPGARPVQQLSDQVLAVTQTTVTLETNEFRLALEAWRSQN